MNHEGRMYREGDPDTSIEAAEHVDATRLEAMVLEAVSKYPNGCIQDDVLNVYRGMPYSSITARFISLKRKGCIVYTGEKRVGRSGRNQRVMQITEQGLTMIEHTQRKHARLSASRADRFMACPGSVALESQMPYEPAGEAAAIGTHIHELSEMLLNGTHTYEEIKSSAVEVEHLNMAQEYASFVNNLVENPRKRLIEVNVDEGLKSLHPSLGGTADAVLTESRTLHVIDLKTGRIPVSAKDNKQLLVYALGAARKLGAPADITVKMHIFQPRTGHSVAEISGNDLISFGHELKAAAELANTPGAPVVPGSSQCQWCRAKPICSAIREKVTNAAREVFDVNNDVTPAMIEDAKLAETWAGSVLDAAKKQLTDKPESISGWYMKTGRKSKFWRDEALVWEALKGNDQAFELKSPAAILKAKIDISEDMIGEKIGASILTKSKSEE